MKEMIIIKTTMNDSVFWILLIVKKHVIRHPHGT